MNQNHPEDEMVDSTCISCKETTSVDIDTRICDDCQRKENAENEARYNEVRRIDRFIADNVNERMERVYFHHASQADYNGCEIR